VTGSSLAFGSTARALRQFASGSLDETAVAEFLEFGFITDEHSIYSGIEKVRPGEVVEWCDGQISRWTYWKLPDRPGTASISFDEAVEETERLFVDAVEKRLHADVPVGALLSGGIDSSLVCWAIGKLGGDVTAYTVATPGDVEDESEVAINTAKRLRLQHKLLEISSSIPPNISELTEAFAEPFACASAIGMLKISQEARKSVTVLLTGDGGDDVFLGYPEHRHFQLSGDVARRLPAASTGFWQTARNVVPQVGVFKRARSFVDYSVGGLGAVGIARDGLPFYQKNRILGERLHNVVLGHRQIDWSVESGRNLLSDFLAYDRRTRFTGEYLTKVDGATMYHAVEARSPFLDSNLWEFASDLPYSTRLKEGKSKAILREIARRRIGHSLATGRKKGFTIPVQRWITNEWRRNITDTLTNSLLAAEGWIDAKRALDLFDRCERDSWAPRQFWFLYVLESWLRYEKSVRAI
jgi:asparagine synthase (glutamine-hydrolysing)